MTKSESGTAKQENTAPQTTILLAAKKNKPKNENKEPIDPDLYKQKSSKPLCQDLLNDVRALLDGGGKEIKNPNDYKIGGRSLLPDGISAIKSSIESRIADLKSDPHNLYVNHREIKDAHPKYGSYVGHQKFLEIQQKALQSALGKLKDKCKDFTPEEQALIDRAKEAIKTPIPTEPDPKQSTNATENKGLKQIIDGIPGLSQDQKDAVGKTLNGIQKVVDKGQDYWNKQGKQQVIDTLTTVAKIPFLLAVLIVAAIAAAFGFDSPLKVEAGSSDKTASAPENSTTASSNSTNSTGSPATPPEQTSNTANTGKQGTAFIIQNPTANTGKQDTAFIIPTGGSTALTGRNTALTGGSTALTGGETPQQSNNNNIELTA